MEKLPIDLFIKLVSYLPFKDVVSLCTTNSKFHNFSVNNKYNIHWKMLIHAVFNDYQNEFNNIQQYYDTNNYITYTQLIEKLNVVSRLMIYYQQGDIVSFNSFSKKQRFFALFLLNKKKEMKKFSYNTKCTNYKNNYKPFIDLLEGNNFSIDKLNNMFIKIVKYNNLKGIKYFVEKGADVHCYIHKVLQFGLEDGNLNIIKYLIENGSNKYINWALRKCCKYGQLDIAKYLVENGADIHDKDGLALLDASYYGHLNIVKYLVENGANIHTQNDAAINYASQYGHLSIIKYLVESGINIGVETMRLAILKNRLDFVKYLVESGFDIHIKDDYSLIYASNYGYLDIVKYLVEQGANIHAQNNKALIVARQKEVIKYLIEQGADGVLNK